MDEAQLQRHHANSQQRANGQGEFSADGYQDP
jgi:hypothetical protein